MMKLLLVEDDKFYSQIISEYLSDNGLDSKIVHTTEDALNVSLDDFDAVIIDVMLPNNPSLSGISIEESRAGHLAGVALARKFKISKPKMPIVLLSSDQVAVEAKRWARENNVPFVSKSESWYRFVSVLSDLGVLENKDRPRAFIVHGHDEMALHELKDYLQNTLGWPEPVILREKPNKGKTIIEKFEEYAGRIDYVFVLVTPDDTTFDPKTNDEKRRSRQNVIFELGFFYGFLGRKKGRVIVLKKGDVDIPSDIEGIVWINIDKDIRSAGEDIRRELNL
jgi:CheY-like chemotaxis protein